MENLTEDELCLLHNKLVNEYNEVNVRYNKVKDEIERRKIERTRIKPSKDKYGIIYIVRKDLSKCSDNILNILNNYSIPHVEWKSYTPNIIEIDFKGLNKRVQHKEYDNFLDKHDEIIDRIEKLF